MKTFACSLRFATISECYKTESLHARTEQETCIKTASAQKQRATKNILFCSLYIRIIIRISIGLFGSLKRFIASLSSSPTPRKPSSGITSTRPSSGSLCQWFNAWQDSETGLKSVHRETAVVQLCCEWEFTPFWFARQKYLRGTRGFRTKDSKMGQYERVLVSKRVFLQTESWFELVHYLLAFNQVSYLQSSLWFSVVQINTVN